ncbi:MAG: hypothetical protein ACMZ64_09540 [Oleiphilus sp.]
MSQEFESKLVAAGFDAEMLKELMADIDSEKRAIKSHLSQLSSEPDVRLKGAHRQSQIRKMKDKLSFLVENREEVRKRLGRIKLDKKALNKVSNRISPDFSQAFMAAAERILNEEQFIEIELRASEMLAADH